MHESTDFFTFDYLLEVAEDVHIEDVDRKVILHTHGSGSDVHHFESLCYYLLIGDVMILGSGRILLWVCSIYSIDTCALEHYVGFYFYSTET